MLGLLIFCILFGIFIIMRAYLQPMQPIEYAITLIVLVCILGYVIMGRPGSLMEPFTQVLAHLDTNMLSEVVQLPTTVGSNVSNGVNYLIQVQKNLTKTGGSKTPKDLYKSITKETLEEPNLSNEEYQRIGKEYLILDDMLNTLEGQHEGLYKSLMANVKVVNPYDAIKKKFGLTPVVQEEQK